MQSSVIPTNDIVRLQKALDKGLFQRSPSKGDSAFIIKKRPLEPCCLLHDRIKFDQGVLVVPGWREGVPLSMYLAAQQPHAAATFTSGTKSKVRMLALHRNLFCVSGVALLSDYGICTPPFRARVIHKCRASLLGKCENGDRESRGRRLSWDARVCISRQLTLEAAAGRRSQCVCPNTSARRAFTITYRYRYCTCLMCTSFVVAIFLLEDRLDW